MFTEFYLHISACSTYLDKKNRELKNHTINVLALLSAHKIYYKRDLHLIMT